jgi:hypothetical protein
MERYYLPRGFVNNFGAKEVTQKMYGFALDIIKRKGSSVMDFNEPHVKPEVYIPWKFEGKSYAYDGCYIYVGEASNINQSQREGARPIPLIRIHHDREDRINQLEKELGLDN